MSYFSYVGKLFSNFKGFYKEINAATLTGAIDTIIIEQKDGTYKSSPFHLRFGKLGVLRSREKVVDIEINGEPVHIQMKLGESGEAFFVEEFSDDEEDLPSDLATSPLQSDVDFMHQGIMQLKKEAEAFDMQLNVVGDKVIHETKTEANIEVDKITDPQKALIDKNIIYESSQVKVEEEVQIRNHLDSVKSDNSRDADIDARTGSDTGEVNKGKRKKWHKRKSKQIKQDVPTNNTTDQPCENELDEIGDIFEMEDLSSDDEVSLLASNMSQGAMSKSISLPVVEEDKFERINEWASMHEGFAYRNSHPFSDTDLSPLASPAHSRPHSPKSDTEVERQKSLEQRDRLLESEDDTLWEWGSMPRKSVIKSDTLTQEIAQDDKSKTSGGLFHFMRKTKNVRHKPEEEGIYLDDLKLEHMDAETAKLYFPKRFSNTHFKSIEKNEDVESGCGQSLPHSPHSVEGAIGGPSTTVLISEVKFLGTYSLSLCGGLSEPEGVTLEKFMSKIVTFEDLCNNPAMLTNTDLVVKVEDNYFNWSTVAPMVLCQITFNKKLPEKTVQSLISQHMPKKKEKKATYSWFSWRRTAPETAVSISSSTSVTITMPGSENAMAKSDSENTSHTTSATVLSVTSVMKNAKKVAEVDRLTVGVHDHSSSEGDTEGSEKGIEKKKIKRVSRREQKKVFRKSLRLSTEQIKQLNLKPGQNEVVYSVTTQYQGTKRCQCHIYLWNYNDKIIVSDIDGTITKSDVLGQILPVMGRDWSQSGVAQLYSRIQGNGYKFLYLSARAIGQSKLTKDLLQNIKQGGMTLPEGPLLLSPTSLISAFHKEVIERKPEEFKISCLTDIANLFPQNTHPFYAGFGNKVNDVYAYKAINIPTYRIFTINPYGEIKHELSYTFQTSYTKLTDVADHFFPPLHIVPGTRSNEFNEVNFWRNPLPDISSSDMEKVIIDIHQDGLFFAVHR